MMYTCLYGIIFAFSVICVFFISGIEFKKISHTQWTIMMLIQFVNFGYVGVSAAKSVEEAIVPNVLVYIGGTLLPTVFMFSMFDVLKIKVQNRLKNLFYLFSLALLICSWRGYDNGVFFKSFEIIVTGKGTLVSAQAGYVSTIQTVYMYGIMLAMFIAFAKVLKNKELINKMAVRSYFCIALIISLTYFIHLIFVPKFKLLPLAYLICLFLAAISYGRNLIYDINSIVEHEIEKNGIKNGYVIFDLKKKFLGSTDIAEELIPDISNIKLNSVLTECDDEICGLFSEAIDNLESGKNNARLIKRNDIACKYTVSYFSLKRNGGTSGYIFEISDDTEHQKHIEFMENYNTVLKEDVKNQTENISKIQEKVVLGLANMIENRDNNTGGHVKRTSDIVQILVNAMLENNTQNIEHTFAEDVIRAAPMHDLGKIAVDNSILCKPGKLTDEEYVVMKSHAAKSGEIVLNILEGVEKQHFVNVAFNVARHHHERWDGRGYPDNLQGEDIPLEARIMAVADVYDALVSKRCYKEAMSYEKAYDIMMENMGSQFDPSLGEIFTICREKLEEYYKRANAD